MFERADETSLVVLLCVKLRAIGLLGREHGVDDARELAGGSHLDPYDPLMKAHFW